MPAQRMKDEGMESTIYTDGTYLRNNPDWHTDDSAWKAAHIAKLLARHGVKPNTVCEIGCGAGEILRNLATHLEGRTKFFGYEISPDAYQLCARKSGGNFAFRRLEADIEIADFKQIHGFASWC